MIKKNITIKYKGKIDHAEIYYTEESPWIVNLIVNENINISVESDNLFDALQEVRNKAADQEILILCNGARKDVYPSSMSKSMGGGILAYELTLGKQAQRANLVNIFDDSRNNPIVTPDEQKDFYNKWIKSLG